MKYWNILENFVFVLFVLVLTRTTLRELNLETLKLCINNLKLNKMDLSRSNKEKRFNISDVSKKNWKSVSSASLENLKTKISELFNKKELPNIHLHSDGTEIDDEEYFETLQSNTELIATFTNERLTNSTEKVSTNPILLDAIDGFNACDLQDETIKNLVLNIDTQQMTDRVGINFSVQSENKLLWKTAENRVNLFKLLNDKE